MAVNLNLISFKAFLIAHIVQWEIPNYLPYGKMYAGSQRGLGIVPTSFLLAAAGKLNRAIKVLLGFRYLMRLSTVYVHPTEYSETF